jgi:hypothetical protein
MRRALVLLTALVAVVAATAAPAGAGSRPTLGSTACWNGLDRLLTSAANARGGPVREKDTGDLPEEAPHVAAAPFAVTVPVWFHVISPDGVEGNVSQAVIDDQMREFNEDFAGGEGGLATGFTFRLVGVTRTTNADWFGLKDTADEQKMKKALRVGGAETLNVYTTSGAGFLGWAYYPSTYHGREYIDGIVLDYRSLPGGPYGERFSLGKTLTHEAGHWLGLYHTFQGGCNDKGDYVDDTPAMLVPTSGCPADKDTCPKKPGLDPIHNYMDYSWDSCYSEFTPDQAARMQDQWLAFRAGQ